MRERRRISPPFIDVEGSAAAAGCLTRGARRLPALRRPLGPPHAGALVAPRGCGGPHAWHPHASPPPFGPVLRHGAELGPRVGVGGTEEAALHLALPQIVPRDAGFPPRPNRARAGG